MTICQSRSLVNYAAGHAKAVSLRCRAWSCPECGPRRRNQLIAEAAAGNPNRFVTLTVNPAVGVSPADRAARLARAWRLCVQRWRRLHSNQRLAYMAVFEATKRGEPHLHILVRGAWISQKWLSETMRGLVNSPIVDVRKIDNGRGVAGYVAKYIGKDPHRFATCKRYWSTRDWQVTPQEQDRYTGDWHIDDRPVWKIEQDWQAAGAACARTGDGELTATWEAWRAEHYPRAGPWSEAAAWGSA